MIVVNQDLFLSDYNALEAEKVKVPEEAEKAVNVFNNLRDEAKQQIKDIIIREKIAEIDNQKAFYEKYLVEQQEEIVDEITNQY